MWIINELDDLDMPCRSRTDLFIRGKRSFTSTVSGFDILDSFDSLKSSFHAPETSSSQYNNFISSLTNNFWHKFDRKRIDAMTRIFFGHFFTDKHMPQMPTTARASDLSTYTIAIRNPSNSTRNSVIKTWPSTSRVKFIFAMIQRSETTPTHVRSFSMMIPILSRKSRFSSLVHYYSFFICTQGLKFHR